MTDRKQPLLFDAYLGGTIPCELISLNTSGTPPVTTVSIKITAFKNRLYQHGEIIKEIPARYIMRQVGKNLYQSVPISELKMMLKPVNNTKSTTVNQQH